MKNKNILIIENLDTHHPLVITFINLLEECEGLTPIALVTEENVKRIKSNFQEFYKLNNKKFFLFPSKKIDNLPYKILNSIKKFIRTIKIVKKQKIDVIFLNTPEAKRNFLLLIYFLFTNKKIVLTHHDSLPDKTLGKFYLFLLKKVIKKSIFSIFLGDYLKEDIIFKDKNKIYVNYVYDSDGKKYKKYEKRTFAINSNPKIENRDYRNLFRAFGEIIKENKELKKKFQIIIPAKIKSKEILKIINKNKLSNITTTFLNYVPEERFIEILKRSHYSILPLYPNAKSGTSRITATMSYNCAFKLPVVVPKIYFKNAKVKNHDYAYEYNFGDDSLKQILKKLIIKKYDSQEVNRQFSKYEEIYSLDKIRNKITKLL